LGGGVGPFFLGGGGGGGGGFFFGGGFLFLSFGGVVKGASCGGCKPWALGVSLPLVARVRACGGDLDQFQELARDIQGFNPSIDAPWKRRYTGGGGVEGLKRSRSWACMSWAAAKQARRIRNFAPGRRQLAARFYRRQKGGDAARVRWPPT